MIERGREIRHQQDYDTETKAPWDMPFRGQGDTALYEREYRCRCSTAISPNSPRTISSTTRRTPTRPRTDTAFTWFRSYQLGGRSLTWGRQCYRWSDYDFGANARDGHGTDWPIRYADLAPWYDKVESFIGVSGAKEGLKHCPMASSSRPWRSTWSKPIRAEIASAGPNVA
jgi:choline dehydrogenase-like flavoprotein